MLRVKSADFIPLMQPYVSAFWKVDSKHVDISELAAATFMIIDTSCSRLSLR